MKQLSIQTKKEFRNFGLAFGLGYLLVQILPLIYGMTTAEVDIFKIIGLILISPFSSPTILFFGIAILQRYNEKSLFWVGIIGVWVSVMMNLYIQHGGDTIFLDTIFRNLIRKGLAMILSLLVLRFFFQKTDIIRLIIGFGAIILLAVINSFATFNDQLTTDMIIQQSIWGALFYVFSLSLGYTLFTIFKSNDDSSDEITESEIPVFKSSQLVFYFMIFGLYFSDLWSSGQAWQTQLNVLFLLLFACIGIIYFSKNIITIGMALSLISLIGRLIAFYNDMSTMNIIGLGFSLLVLALFELSRRQENKITTGSVFKMKK
ncbi:hypothetical protein EI427_19695 [Flammeovirga pectinis]|uniref:Uncharacterized protein n=1 Tax=Flammeovirga pectinis TaxID=2494373 RepID=A0A3Q9FSV5_9BACT|nr:hypothetical protein [Flammeovirga pectinis]AZQ64355.1 hypothetical protein EI427_19695 [Flammeovirga pectinis]